MHLLWTHASLMNKGNIQRLRGHPYPSDMSTMGTEIGSTGLNSELGLLIIRNINVSSQVGGDLIYTILLGKDNS